MSAELTLWFQSGEKPSIAGVYETRIPNVGRGGSFQYWNGRRWGCYGKTADNAVLSGNAEYASNFQSVQWRGLASDPKAGKP
jgi:hypothetical protein